MYIPGHFGDPQAEYDRLLNGVAMWDVAAERQVELSGPDAAKLARYLTPRNLDGLQVGQGRYVPLCDHDGLLINDPVLLKLSESRFWLSVADSDIFLWAGAIAKERGWDADVFEPDVSPLAIQGPRAEDVTAALLGDWVRDLRLFRFRETVLDGMPMVVMRSGWSHQDGFELFLQDAGRGTQLWNAVKRAGAPFGIGPGAPNDIERLESGLISYGADMRRQIIPANPFEMGFGNMVDLESGREFVGRDALLAIREKGVQRRRSGVIVGGAPVTNSQHAMPLFQAGKEVGIVSEIAYSRRLSKTIGVALVDTALPQDAAGLELELRDGPRAVQLAGLPFA
jgi:aminomethyltransferase